MTEVLQKLMVYADGSQKYIPLSAEEIAQRELDAAAYAEQKATEEAAELAKAEARSLVEAKALELGLTAEEIAALSK